jgi:trehalose-6-phosphate synthase
LKESPASVVFHDRTVHISVYPICIEPQNFTEGMEKHEVKTLVASLAQYHRDKKITIGVDRLDYIKGIPPKLNALELFLEKHAEWVGKLAMIQVAIPSREDVKEYRELAGSLHQ